jgi:alpha-amylase/alpha-mannosidase (GH57 family)
VRRAICIHGHFYQPPRENPWLEDIELQDSAYPYHDWNERITAECYAPNARSRIVDEQGHILRMVSNYERMSFNFGPTVLAWMERAAPDVYDEIIAADARGAGRHDGHGPAIAQAYGHLIMPLASARDKETQVRWGVKDFRHRFGRDPEGMWLPETAVDLASLDAMAQAGIAFTILEPHQVSAVRAVGDTEWTDVSGGRVDPTMPYRVSLPEGRSIAVFVYDGPASQGIAFEGLLNDGNRYADRLLGLFGEADHPQIVSVATDGETYGHHQRHGDMALAWALERIDADPSVELTVYGQWLERHPPTHEAQILENTAWSCVHGVDRWRTDCGCASGMHPRWHQRWREPLRDALDWLRSEIDAAFEIAGRDVFTDPWGARNAYIGPILDRSDESVDAFLLEWTGHNPDHEEAVRALQLMELQRHAMLMYTSCGWFFDELSGIETVQVIEYAARAIQLAAQALALDLEAGFVERLERAESNFPETPDGRAVYERHVRPTRVTLADVAAHYALTSMFEDTEDETEVRAFTVARTDHRSDASGPWQLGTGRVSVTSRITRESEEIIYGVLHFGDHNLTAGVGPARRARRYSDVVERVFAPFEQGDLPSTLRELDSCFPAQRYTLSNLFRDDRRRIVNQILKSTVEEVADQIRSVYETRVPLLRFLASVGVPLPDELTSTARTVLNHELAQRLSDPDLDLAVVSRLLEDAAQIGATLDREGLGFELAHTIESSLEGLEADPGDIALLERVTALVDLARSAPLDVDLMASQNIFYRLKEAVFDEMRSRTSGRARRWESGFRELGALLEVRVD